MFFTAAAALCFIGMDTKTWEVEMEQKLNADSASFAVARIIHDCKSDQFRPAVDEASCNEIIPNQSESLACFVRTNLGMFYVTKGYMDVATITYHRYD